jgi:hypothetical protein
VTGRPITEVLAGGFMIWLTAWDSEVSGLDVWLAAEGGKKLMDLLWSGDEGVRLGPGHQQLPFETVMRLWTNATSLGRPVTWEAKGANDGL